MKKLFLIIFVLFVISCTTTKKTAIHTYNKDIILEDIDIRKIALQDAYEAFGYPDSTIVLK